MSVRITRPPSVAFVQIRNVWARDRRISLKSKGLLTYLHSHQEGYELSLAQIIRDSTDGKDAVRTALEDLEAAGYLGRVRGRDGSGRFGETDYVLADPFDAAGRLLPVNVRETRPDYEGDERESRQSGLSAAEEPLRETRPIEDKGENTTESPTDSPASGQLRLVEHPPRAGVSDAAAFDAFWEAYPRKVSKDAARRAWRSACKRARPADIIAAVRAYPWSPDPQYVPHPATWLNGGRWMDDPAAARPRAVGGGPYGPQQPYRNPNPADDPHAFDGDF